MKCQGLRGLIPDYLAEELSPETLREFQDHLTECDLCREELKQTEAVWITLGKLPDEEPSPVLRARFYTMLEDEKRQLAAANRTPWFESIDKWLGSWWPRRPAVQVALAVVLLVVGLAMGSSVKTEERGNGEMAQLRDEVQQMHQMVSLSLLNQDSSSERLRGVNWSARVAEPSQALLTSLTNTLQSDPNVNVRIAAVDALALFRDEPGVMDVLTNSLTEETSPEVQIALIDLLIAVQEKRALESLKSFVEKQNVIPAVKEHAENKISDTL